jgi:tRNA A22 N-methylase
MANAREAGFFEKIKFVLTDGAAALEGEELTDVAICGMGGELIAAIIDASPFLKDEKIRLILQPMSRQGQLRHYLAANGFSVIKEVYSYSQGKYYVTICAEYSGECYEPSLYERELGRVEFLDTGCPECLGYLDARLKVYAKIARGKREGGEDTCDEALLYQYIKELEKQI